MHRNVVYFHQKDNTMSHSHRLHFEIESALFHMTTRIESHLNRLHHWLCMADRHN